MKRRRNKNVLFISLSQFGMAFSFNFVMVFLPFFIHRTSPYSTGETLIWVGLIMGSTSFAAAFASTFWGALASHVSPKTLYVRGLISHCVAILLMGFVSSLPLLLALRIFQGMLGGISTIGLIIVSSSSPRELAAGDIGFFQNSLTMGQLLGPPVGALAASMMGYRGAFVGAAALVLVTLIFCLLYVDEVPRESAKRSITGKHTLNKQSLIAWGLCCTTSIQLIFLPSVLPNVFGSFHIGHEVALQWSGVVVMAYTATAMTGTYLLCRLTSRIRIVRLIAGIGALGILFQCLLALTPDMISFVAVRAIQTGLIAATIPLTISLFASNFSGKVIGFLNSGRFAGNAVGPVIGTWVLALSDLNLVFIVVGILSILPLLGFALFFGSSDAGTTDSRDSA